MNICFCSTVEEVGSHQEFEGDLGWNGKLRNLSGAVGVLDFVGEVHADLLEDVRGYLAEVDLVGLVLAELARSGQHGLDCARGEGVVSLDDELVAVRRDELDVHGVGALAAAVNPRVAGLSHHVVGGHAAAGKDQLLAADGE